MKLGSKAAQLKKSSYTKRYEYCFINLISKRGSHAIITV